MKSNKFIVTSSHDSVKGYSSVGGYLSPIYYNNEKGVGFFCPPAKLCCADDADRVFEPGDVLTVKEIGKDRFHNVLCILVED